MTNTPEQLAELTVSNLFTSGQYIIPIYQRNYAWGKTEIEQLLQDLMDAASQSPQKDYYLGSLVVHQGEDDKNGRFEIIDGQQRHTTLCILMAVLKNEYKKNLTEKGINLGFEHRSVSNDTLQHLFDNGLKSDARDMESAMVGAYKIAQTYLAQIPPKNPDGKENHDNQKCIDVFTTYISEHAKLLRVIVPKDTDLNHYFEIMNSRGEQLEKHEVLKARLMNVLTEPNKQAAFAKIWDACADMSRYVQRGFSATAPKGEADSKAMSECVAIFGDDWNQCPKDNDFDALVNCISNPTISNSNKGNDSENKTLLDILKSPTFKDKKDAVNDDGKYGSVINFPNFLLQVLSVFDPKQPEVTLDDKKLLESFDKFKENDKFTEAFSVKFIMALLQIRYLFDRWIIKTESKQEDWSLEIIKPADKSSYSFANSVADKKINDQLIMMLSMRHVSFPSQNYKQWLREALDYLYKNRAKVIYGHEYLEHLEEMSNTFFSERFKGNEAVLHKGTSVQHFFFNRLDYLLWKKIVIDDGEMPSTGNNEAVKKLAESFRFTFRNSVEHHYAQNLDAIQPLDINKISCDSFGNLCLITHQSNSRLSDRSPHDKTLHQSDNASIKQAIMMSYDGEWGKRYEDNMLNHQNEMIALLKAGSKPVI